MTKEKRDFMMLPPDMPSKWQFVAQAAPQLIAAAVVAGHSLLYTEAVEASLNLYAAILKAAQEEQQSAQKSLTST